MQRKIRVSIVIVVYNGERKRLVRCLTSINNNSPKTPFEVLIVDNGTEDMRSDALRIMPRARYIYSPKNLGYGGGNNLGVKNAKGKYIFVFNNDTKLLKRAIDILVFYLDKHPDTAIAAPNLMAENGRVYQRQGTRILTPLRGIFVMSFLNTLFPDNKFSREYFLDDMDLSAIRQTDTVPGAAFMIRKNVFQRVGMFDENIFLFNEEQDLGKRVREAGYKIIMHSQANVIHEWTHKKKHEGVYEAYANFSRFYYFKKHYGLFIALIVEMFCRFSKWTAMAIGVVTVGVILRMWDIQNTMYFIGDFGWYYISARDMILHGTIPLIGIASSVPILYQGALWTWMLAFFLWVGSFNPLYGAYLAILIGALTIIITYLVTSKMFSKEVGTTAALLFATSPFVVLHDRMPYHTVPIAFITILVGLFTYRAYLGKEKSYLWLGFLLAVLFQFELAGFIMVPIILATLVWSDIKKLTISNVLQLSAGWFWGLLPFLIYDLTNGVFIQTIGFGVWFLSKIWEGMIGFLAHDGESVKTANYGITYMSDLVFPTISGVATGVIGTCICYLILKIKKRVEPNFAYKFLFVWLVIGLLSFLVRGTFSEAYIPLLYFPVLVSFALLLSEITERRVYIGVFLIILLSTFHITSLLGRFTETIPFSDRIATVDFIIQDANGSDFSLHYFGPQYMYAAGDDNWQYLLWWRGNEPKVNIRKSYTLYEGNGTKTDVVNGKRFGDIMVEKN